MTDYGCSLPHYVPTDRLRPIIERSWTRQGRTLDGLAERSGVTSRTLRAIMNAERPSVRFTVADKVVTAIDVYLWLASPPHGLGDLYELDDPPSAQEAA